MFRTHSCSRLSNQDLVDIVVHQHTLAETFLVKRANNEGEKKATPKGNKRKNLVSTYEVTSVR